MEGFRGKALTGAGWVLRGAQGQDTNQQASQGRNKCSCEAGLGAKCGILIRQESFMDPRPNMGEAHSGWFQ